MPESTEEAEGQTERMVPEEDTTLAPPPGDGEEGTKVFEAKKEGLPPPPPPPGAGKTGPAGPGKLGEGRKEDPEAKDWSGHWSPACPE
ncbi:hypothetical protein NDU88_005567 [Pleurodeles waltl]|uniref:Uncharacterized protein n=1 Tax=Pleurodeles waltl TaxID=8319 RepID=A0AAV7W869_PLEWA|nr:hypothetical protein NDU88_005567 [Pleurodeles waltl]